MDYPFYTHEHARLSAELVAALQQQALKITYTSHKAFGAAQLVLTCQEQFIPGELLQELIASIPMLTPTSFSGYEVNKLPPGGRIVNHSDLNSRKPGVGYAIAHRHKLHIPLFTNDGALTYHRRSKHQSWNAGANLKVGSAYLYNDYVWHAYANQGTSDRIHLLISFWDRDWTQRDTLLSAITQEERYEA